MAKSKKLKELKHSLGRASWEGVKPITRVVPNKKKVEPSRKAKHKGRLDSADPFFVWWVPNGRQISIKTCAHKKCPLS